MCAHAFEGLKLGFASFARFSKIGAFILGLALLLLGRQAGALENLFSAGANTGVCFRIGLVYLVAGAIFWLSEGGRVALHVDVFAVNAMKFDKIVCLFMGHFKGSCGSSS